MCIEIFKSTAEVSSFKSRETRAADTLGMPSFNGEHSCGQYGIFSRYSRPFAFLLRGGRSLLSALVFISLLPLWIDGVSYRGCNRQRLPIAESGNVSILTVKLSLMQGMVTQRSTRSRFEAPSFFFDDREYVSFSFCFLFFFF